ncbi:uncharacterized protein PHALS_08236 [Plasmopara halstedii]|uniref:Uncharacterized protein n=1 Tax=Plasmopara halstedii TaxID=4781 RepID=A0A0N7L4A7_PLAHL|nr:uncharacterized protein PHALS_08236 [Plasmopara halstedii]CEG38147.1 hypothetical protein PHALS_08236 [Plasmopara halstedii]|eukprot:XP_024574516.1 hypothetical protein PHALS_08236 [Plasmopara halstedii]
MNIIPHILVSSPHRYKSIDHCLWLQVGALRVATATGLRPPLLIIVAPRISKSHIDIGAHSKTKEMVLAADNIRETLEVSFDDRDQNDEVRPMLSSRLVSLSRFLSSGTAWTRRILYALAQFSHSIHVLYG